MSNTKELQDLYRKSKGQSGGSTQQQTGEEVPISYDMYQLYNLYHSKKDGATSGNVARPVTTLEQQAAARWGVARPIQPLASDTQRAADEYAAKMAANERKATKAYEQSRDELNRSWWDVLGNAAQSAWNAVNGIQPSPEQGIRSAEAGQRLAAATQSKDERGRLFKSMETAKSTAQDARDYQQYVRLTEKYGSTDALAQDYAERIKAIEDEYRDKPDQWRQARKQAKALEKEKQQYVDFLHSYETNLKNNQENAAVLDAWVKGNGGTYASYQLAQKNYDELDRRVTQLQNQLTAAGAAEADYSGWATDEMTAAAIANRPTAKGNTKEIQTQLEQAIRERDQAGMILQYARSHQGDELDKAPDFELKAASGEEKFKAFKQEQAPLREAYETNVGYATDEMSAAAIGDYVPYDPRLYSEYREPDERWTEDEKKRFYYLFDDEKTRQQAYDYAIGIDQKYNRSEAEDRDWSTREFATRNFGTGALASIGTVGANLAAGGFDFAKMALENAARGGIYETQYEGWTRWADTTRGAITEELNKGGTISKNVPVLGGKGLGDLYQLFMSMAESGVAMSTGGGLTNAMFFGFSAANATRNALERGLAPNKAVALGFAAGVAEVAGETISIEYLLRRGNLADFLRQGLLKSMLKQGAVEGSEEVLTSLLNALADAVQNGDQSELNQKIYTYVANGMPYEQAVRQANKEWIEQIGAEALGGFISGGLLSGGRMALQSGVAAATRYEGDAQGAINLAGLTEEGSRARKMAARYQQRLEKKGDLTNLQAARLRAAVESETSEADLPRLVEDIKRHLQEERFGYLNEDEIDRTAKRVADAVFGIGNNIGQLNDLEKQIAREVDDQLSGDIPAYNKWLNIDGYKTAEASRINAERLKMVTTGDGKKAKVERAVMEDGKLKLVIRENGEEKPLSQDDLKLDEYQKRALQTLTQVLGEDAAIAYNRMNPGRWYGSAFSTLKYATAFATIRDLFGRYATDTEKAERAALNSVLRQGLTDDQVIHAVALGRQHAQEDATITPERSQRGTGRVNTTGTVLHTKDGDVELKPVKNLKKVRASAQFRAVHAVAQALGINVELFESEADKDGNITGKFHGAYVNGTIYLDWNAGMENIHATSERMLLRTMGHEMTHFIQQNAPQEYAQLKGFVLRHLAKNGADIRTMVMEEMRMKLDLSEGMRTQADLTYDQATDELVADACETMLRDSKVVRQLMRENRSVWQRVRDWISSFLRGITAKKQAAIYMQDAIDELREIWDLGLRTAVESRTDTGTASKKAATTGGKVQFSLRDLNIDRKYIKHGDVYAEDAAVRDTVNSLIAREKFVNISARDAAEFNGIDYSDYKVARNAFSKILERFLGETIRMTHGGQMAEVYLTRRGLNHAAVTEYTPGKAAVYKKLRKMITNAEYSYSSVDDPHAETRPKGEAYWDAFVSVARFGKYIFPTVIKFRSLDRDIRSQIYNIASKREEIGSSHSPGLNNQGGLPNYGVTPISDNSIGQDTEEVKGQFSMRGGAKTVDPSGITPVNEITDRSKYDYLVNSFRKDGYRGRPIVAVGDEGDAVALTGSHRLAAAKEADIDVPVVFIPYDSSNEYIMALVDAARDEDRTLAAREAYEAGAISKDVYDLIAREDELNSENYDVPYDQQARFSMRGGTKTDTEILESVGSQQIMAERLEQEKEILQGSVNELQRLLRKRDKTIEGLRRQMRLTKTPELRMSDAKRMTRSLLQDYDSRADAERISGEIKELCEFVLGTELGGEAYDRELERRIGSIAREVVSNAKAPVTEGTDVYREIARRIKGAKVSIDERTLGELGDFEAFRKRLFGRITIAKRRANTREGREGYASADQVYTELQSDYGETIFPDALDEGEQLLNIARVLELSTPQEANPFAQDMDAAEESVRGRILMDIYSGMLQFEAPTAADRAKSRREALQQQVKELQRQNKLSEKEAERLAETVYDLSLNLDQAQSRYRTLAEQSKKKLNELQKYKDLNDRYREKEREVNAALQELDRLVQHSGDRKQIQAQRAKVSAKEQQMAKALERLTQAKGGSEIQEILRQEREIQAQRIQDRVRDSVNRRDLRQRISKLWKDLNQKATNPNEKKHIPPELMQQTLDVLEAINMDTSREGSKAGEKLRAKLDSLRARYEELKNDPDFRRAAVYDAQVAEYLTNMIAQVGDTPINKMSVAQMETVLETLSAMVYTARRALKLKLGEQEVEAYDVSRAMTKETRSVEKPKTGALSTWLNAQLSPERMFNRLGGYSKDSYWNRVYGMLNEGQLKQIRLQMEGSLIFEDLMEKENEKNFRKLLDPKNTVDIGLKDENGEPVLITHGMMISLYMHLQNDQNRDHVLYGGLTIPSLKDYYNGKKVKGEERAVRVGGVLQEIRDLNERIDNTDDVEELLDLQAKRDQIGADYYSELMTAIEAQLTDYDRQWIAASRELFDGFSKRELNKTTLDVYGIKRANVENYFPIWVDGDFLNTPFETVTKNMSLENAGFMKERINSKKPIRLGDISDVASSQIRKVAQYCGLMPAIRSFNKVWGKTEQDYRDSLQKAVHETFGQAGVKYVENLMADLNGARGGQDSALGEFLNRMRGHMAQASLTMSLRVAMGQTASYPTAAAVVGWGPLMKALAHGGRNNTIISRADQELIRKWSPLLYYRLKGYSTTELGDIAGMNDKFSRLWKKARWLTGWIQAMDGATVGRLWYAAEYYVQDHNKALAKGTDAYYEAVAKVFNDIVEKTQPDYTTMQRPDILRNPNALVKQLTMFLTQRLQNFNILYDAAATYSKYKADFKAGRNGVTTEDVRQAGIATRRAVISQLAAAATITAFKFLADAILHSLKNYRDDDDELTKQSVSLELLDMFMDSLAGNVLGGGEVYDLIESKVFGKTYYGIEVSGLATVTDLVDAFSSAFDHALKGELSWKDADKLVRNLATVAGIPYANAKKFVQAGIWYAQDVRNGEWLWESNAGIDRSTSQQASRLYRAYTNGDGAKVKQILEEVPEDKQKDVYSAVRKLIREQQKSGEINVYEAMRQMKNYGGSTDQIMAEYIKDLYEAGALPKADAEKYLQEYAGKTKEAATKTVTNVDGKQASGVNYNDIDDMFKLGTMNAEEARKALVGYGIAQDTANMKVEYWSYQQKNPGTAMTTEDRFETYWKKYRPVGMTPSMYDNFYVQWNAVQGTDKNHDGKADANSKKPERIAIIDSLPLSREQKDALFSMEWKTGLQDAPWNK